MRIIGILQSFWVRLAVVLFVITCIAAGLKGEQLFSAFKAILLGMILGVIIIALSMFFHWLAKERNK